MADPITWGLINLVKKGVKGVQTTLDGVKNSVDTLPEDVQTKLDAFEVTIDELKKNVEDTLSDVQETVEKSPAGLPPSGLEGFTAMSKEEGIEVVYTANAIRNSSGENTSNDAGLIYDSMTKGVMIRYSKDQYPTNIDEGELAVIDEDIYTIDELGARKVKTKKFTIVGLTNNLKYYISAFPYSYNNVYNISSGSENGAVQKRNRVTCQWTGTKGTLTVNVTQDNDYKPLGEYTVTMTPIAGGEAITKTQSGATTVVFSGLEAGEYTLSFSKPQYFNAPESQSVTVVAGQSNTIDGKYILNVTLNDLTWDEIRTIVKSGQAKNLLNVGDVKENEKLKKVTFSGTGTNDRVPIDEYTTQDITCGIKLIGFDKDGARTATFVTTKSVFKSNTTTYNSWNSDYYAGGGIRMNYPSIRSRILKCQDEIFTSEIKNVVMQVSKITCDTPYGGGSFDKVQASTTDTFFPLSLTEVGCRNTANILNEKPEVPYDIFTNDESRKLDETYVLRSRNNYRDELGNMKSNTFSVDSNGKCDRLFIDGFLEFPLCFVVG